jgi:secreted trypsin-like serine protease
VKTLKFLICTAIGATVGCSHGGAEPQGNAAADIIGGQTDTGDSAIVELEMDRTDGYDTCTATFISTTVLLTAAHCVVSEDSQYQIPADAKFRVMLAASRDAATDADWIDVDTSNVHPNPSYHGDGVSDVAVVILTNPVAVTPIPILRQPIDQVSEAAPGASVRLVGYGQSVKESGPNDGAETKRAVTTKLVRLEEDQYLLIGETGQQACSGDSGGPALVTIGGVETIIGTDDLSSTDQACTAGDLYQRVDLYLDFIDSFLQRGGKTEAPPPDGADTPSGSPPAIDGATLYDQNCSSCHGDEKKGSSADDIQRAIDNDKGGMGQLNFLTPDQIAAIAAAP